MHAEEERLAEGHLERVGMRRTALWETHRRAGARFTEFCGWEMPLQYSSIVEEHTTVRASVGLFDVSHMGEISVKGPQALATLQLLTSNDVSKLVPGKAQYSLLLNEQGGVIDDIIVYMLGVEDYFVCVNAANAAKDYHWLCRQDPFGSDIRDVSGSFSQIALQGPGAETVIGLLCGRGASEFGQTVFPAFCHRQGALRCGSVEVEALVARTGYTGEDGFEIFCPWDQGPVLWDSLMEAGKDYGIKPVGLAARDTLRLEACLPLHGHELREDVPAICCGVGWTVKFRKGDFIGREALAREEIEGCARVLVGLEALSPGIMRAGAPVFSGGEIVGEVTSGTKPPTVGRAIALAFVRTDLSKVGNRLEAEVRGKRIQVSVVKRPFYRRRVS